MADKKAVKDLKNSEKYEKIREDLLDQLDRNGTYGEQFKDLVEDYMAFWITKTLLIEDINKRGVSVKYNNGAIEVSATVSGGTLEWNGMSAEIPVGETIEFNLYK